MGFFRKIAGVLGFGNHEHDSKDESDDEHGRRHTTSFRARETGHPAKGFAVDRPKLAPVLTPSTSGDGELQGLGWYVKRLRMDEDGDVADEFLDEVSSKMPEAHVVDHHKTPARFRLKHDTKPVEVKKQILLDGKIIPQCVEHQGRYP